MKMLRLFLCLAVITGMTAFAWENDHSPKFTRASIPLVEEEEDLARRFAADESFDSAPNGIPGLYSADLNKDGRKDYILERFNAGACGLAACVSELSFFLSCPNGYMKSVFTVYCFDKEDIIQYGEANYFLLTTMVGWKSHTYWLHRIFSFGNDGLMREADDEVGAPFPSCIQYLRREVHDQAKLPDAEKKRMWEKAKGNVFD